MIQKIPAKQFDVGTTWIGNALVALGLVGADGVNFDILADAIMDDPVKYAIMFGLWVAFYVFGKEPAKPTDG